MEVLIEGCSAKNAQHQEFSSAQLLVLVSNKKGENEFFLSNRESL